MGILDSGGEESCPVALGAAAAQEGLCHELLGQLGSAQRFLGMAEQRGRGYLLINPGQGDT